MLMTQENKFTALQDALLTALRESGDWMTRRDLGEAIGRKSGKLQHYDVQQLKLLEDLGLVESQQRKLGAVLSEFVYRSKS